MGQKFVTVEWWEHTLIIARRTPAAPKIALAGVWLETSFARFKASIAASNKERIRSRPFVGEGFVAIIETWSKHTVAARKWNSTKAARRSPNAR